MPFDEKGNPVPPREYLGEAYFDFVEALVLKTLSEGSLFQETLYFLELMFMEFPEGFAKHFEHCEDQNNLVGSSWIEHLGISRHSFWKIFRFIGAYYPSEDALELHEGDRFQGKFYYCVIRRRERNRTYYFRNHELIDGIVEQLIRIAETGDLGLEE